MMRKRTTPKKKPKNIVDKIPTGPLNKKELLVQYRRYYRAANKRIQRLIKYKEREGGSPYAEKYYTSTKQGKLEYLFFKPITKLSWYQQVREWVRLRDFMNAETSTVWGEENYREKQDRFLSSIGIKNIRTWTADEKGEFFNAYKNLMEIKEANFQYQGRGDKSYITEFARISTVPEYNWRTEKIQDLIDAMKILVVATEKEYAGKMAMAEDLRSRASLILHGEPLVTDDGEEVDPRDGLEVYLN